MNIKSTQQQHAPEFQDGIYKASLYQESRRKHWDQVALQAPNKQTWGAYYHEKLNSIYSHLVPQDQQVLEIGCGKGDLLASLNPAYGVGIDFSEEMIKQATARYPQYKFMLGDAHDLEFDGTFDIIILSDLVNDLFDVQTVFEQIKKMRSM